MNLRMPSRREMTAESEMKMERPRCLGWEMRAKMMPMTTASSSRLKMLCTEMTTEVDQQAWGPVLPYPAVVEF